MQNREIENNQVAADSHHHVASGEQEAATQTNHPETRLHPYSSESGGHPAAASAGAEAAITSPLSRRLDMTQGTIEWDIHRAAHRNASEAGCIMNVSPFEPDTWAKLWALKTGRALKEPANAAMLRGLELEKKALACYEKRSGHAMQPQVFVKGPYSASLDGINGMGTIDLEIKCPFRGQASLLWQQVREGRIPAHYYWQIQHQLYVSEAQMAHFFVFDGEKEGLLLEVRPDAEDITFLLAQWEHFWAYIDQDIEPPRVGKDRAIQKKRIWRASAIEYRESREARDRPAGNPAG